MKNQFRKETASLSFIDRIIVLFTIIIVIVTIFMSVNTYEKMKHRLIEVYEDNLRNRTNERIEAINSFIGVSIK